MTIYLNQTDLTVRLQRTADYIASFAEDVAKQFMYGQKCANRNFITLGLLEGYVEVLTCYQPITGNITEEDNCVTEAQAQDMFDHISTLTGLEFASYGASYIS